MSYVFLVETDTLRLYYGLHPSIVTPDVSIDHFVDMTGEDQFPPYLEDTDNALLYKRFPVKDRKAPPLSTLVAIVDYILSLSGNVYVFCKGGHGRSGLVAAAVYAKLTGLPYDEVIEFVTTSWRAQRDMQRLHPRTRRLGSPQTAVQKRRLKEYISGLKLN